MTPSMPARRAAVPVEVLRDALAGKAEATSIRHVAAEVGVSRSGLTAFLQTGTPHSRTYQKLLAWYVRERSREPQQALDRHSAAASLELLTLHLPVHQRHHMQRRIVDLLAEGTPIPPWVKERRSDSSAS